MRKQFSPHSYQNKIIDYQLENPRCAIWAGMGMGKTSSTLTALDLRYLEGETAPTLVLAPKRVCDSTWPDEAKKWEHLRNIDVVPVTGLEKERVAALKRDVSVYACNYQNIPWLIDYYGPHWPFKTIIADESTRLKSFRIKQGGMRARKLAEVVHTRVKRFVQLTGTPSPNGLQDLWGQIWMLDAGRRLGKSYSAFQKRWFRRGENGYGLEPASDFTQPQIYSSLKDICLTIDPRDYFDLNEPIVKNIEVELPERARKLYRQMAKELLLQIDNHTITAANAAVKTQKLLQLANGAVYTDPTVDDDGHPRAREYKAVHDAKLEALGSLVEECNGAPILIAYHFNSDRERILKTFPKFEVLDGNPETLKRWNEGKIPGLLAHPACLHPSTEVLTEFRGWTRIIDVRKEERVFDGIEFVSHSGCQYSGYREVINCFDINMTLEHRLLINDSWERASDVRDNRDIRREARYTYQGNDDYLSEMLKLRHDLENTETERGQKQSEEIEILSGMYSGYLPQVNSHLNMEYLERATVQGTRYYRQRLRRAWHNCVQGMAGIFKFLQGYGADLQTRVNDRTNRRERALFKRELYMGFNVQAASEQTNHQTINLPRAGNTSGGILQNNWAKSLYTHNEAEPGYDTGTSGRGRLSVPLPKEPEKAHVYDLVDCGPRNRFLIRNNLGEVFVSHNSAGHGLNLQDGGNILVFFGHNWNLEERLQIIERIGPMRQLQSGYDRPVWIYNIIAARTMDKAVIDRTDSKKTVQDALLENMKESL